MTEPAERVHRRRSVVSVRVRLVAVITLVAALGMAAVGTAVLVVEHAAIRAQVDERLQDNLESARFIVAGDAADPVTWTSSREALEDIVRRMGPDDNNGVTGIVGRNTAIVPGVAPDVDLHSVKGFIPFAREAASAGSPVLGTYAEEGVAWRFLSVPVKVDGASDDEEAVFIMAYDVAAELAELDDASRVFLIAGILVILGVAGVATLAVGRLLRPLRIMRDTAARISAQSLSERLPIEGHDDVSELAATMNAMLDRLDRALDSQRQLLSDVGHELKTPLTIVRGHIELLDLADPDDVRKTQELAGDELDRMGRLVNDLSSAASLHGPSPVVLRPVDTADLIAQIVEKTKGIDGADASVSQVADVVAPLDAERITQAMLQLAQNAVTHGGGRLAIGSRIVGDALELFVRDWGPGVADDEKESIFERFHRDAGRARSLGSGLGLNIVQVIAQAHGGTARVEDAPFGGAVFTLAVPLASTTEGVSTHFKGDHLWHRS